MPLGEQRTAKGLLVNPLPSDPAFSQRHQRDLEILDSFAYEQFAWDQMQSYGLTFAYKGGVVTSSGAAERVEDGTIVLADNATNYVERDLDGNVYVNQTGFTLALSPMAVVTTRDGAIEDVRDWRLPTGTTVSGEFAGTIDASQVVSGILPSARGGTDQGEPDLGDLLVGGGGAWFRKAAVVAGMVLLSTGVFTPGVPAWGLVTNEHITPSAGIEVSKLEPGTSHQLLETSTLGVPQWITNIQYSNLPTGGGTWANGGTLSITGGITTVAGLTSSALITAQLGVTITSTKPLLWSADNAAGSTIGGATRPYGVYVGTELVVGTDPGGTRTVRVGGAIYAQHTTVAVPSVFHWNDNGSQFPIELHNLDSTAVTLHATGFKFRLADTAGTSALAAQIMVKKHAEWTPTASSRNTEVSIGLTKDNAMAADFFLLNADPITTRSSVRVNHRTATFGIVDADSISDSITKIGTFGTVHYLSDTEEPVTAIRVSSTATVNRLSLGGNSAQGNTITNGEFYAAANQTTLTGTLVGGWTTGGFKSTGLGVWDSATAVAAVQQDAWLVTDVSGTQGSGAYGQGIAFSRIADGTPRRMVALVPRQTTADVDQMGLSLWVHDSATMTTAMSELARFSLAGDLHTQFFGSVFSSSIFGTNTAADAILQRNSVTKATFANALTTFADPTTVAGLLTASAGLTVASGQTLTLTGATVAGAPTWSSNQAITLSTASQPNVTTMSALTTIGTLVAGAVPASLVTAGTFGAGNYVFPGTLSLSTAASQIVPGATSLSLRNNANNADNLLILDAGTATFRAGVIVGAPVRHKGYTVAALPAGTQGDFAFVTDALAPAYHVAAVGGGAVVVPVFYNGAAWIVN